MGSRRIVRQVPRPGTGSDKEDERIIEVNQKISDAKKELRILKDEKRRLLKQIEKEKLDA